MTIQRDDAWWVGGSINGTTGAIVSSNGGFTCANGAAGVNTLTLNEALDLTQCAFIGCVRGATAGSVNFDPASDTSVVARTFDNAGVAADFDFDFIFVRVS